MHIYIIIRIIDIDIRVFKVTCMCRCKNKSAVHKQHKIVNWYKYHIKWDIMHSLNPLCLLFCINDMPTCCNV